MNFKVEEISAWEKGKKKLHYRIHGQHSNETGKLWNEKT